MRWVGALEILGRSDDKSIIWKVDEFPFRFAVKPLVLLEPEVGIRGVSARQVNGGLRQPAEPGETEQPADGSLTEKLAESMRMRIHGD